MENLSPARPLPAAIYARISRDREGAGLGVERQEADCRALAERLGWKVVAVFVDNDISAYSGAPRPQYRAMLDAVRSGEVGGIIAWHTDRLHRRATELEEFVTLAEAQHLQVQTVTAGTVDLSSASGRMVARMLGAAAQHEVDHARERMQRAKAQMAADGKYRGGRRPFGYEKDGVTVKEAEAVVVREATTAVLSGRSLAAVARALNEAKHKTSTGETWTGLSLRDVLMRPRNAGLLSRGQAGKKGFEIVGPAIWPALVEEETWRALFALLTDSSRRTSPGNEARWLGSGIYRCGIEGCGATLRSTATGQTSARPKHSRTVHYRCSANAHLMITQAPTDAYVLGIVAERVRDPRVVEAMHPADLSLSADRERRTVVAARLAGFENDYALGRVTGAQLQKATATATAELAELDRRLSSAVQRSTASPIVNAHDPGAAFLAAPLDVQRAVLSAVLRVEVLPRPKDLRGTVWTPDRLRLSAPETV